LQPIIRDIYQTPTQMMFHSTNYH